MTDERFEYIQEQKEKALVARKGCGASKLADPVGQNGEVITWPSMATMPFIGDRIDFALQARGTSRLKASKAIFNAKCKLNDICLGKYSHLNMSDRVAIEQYLKMPVNFLLGSEMKRRKTMPIIGNTSTETKPETKPVESKRYPWSALAIDEMKFTLTGSVMDLYNALSVLGNDKYDISISIKKKE